MKEGISDDSLLSHSLPLSRSPQPPIESLYDIPESLEHTAPVEHNTDEPRKHVTASKAAMISMASTNTITRRGRFAHVAMNRTVSDFRKEVSDSDSEESEEDPDDEVALESYLAAHRIAMKQPLVDGENDKDEGNAALQTEGEQCTASGALDRDDYSTQIDEPLVEMTESFSSHTMSASQAPAPQVPATQVPARSSNSELQASKFPSNALVRLYIIKRASTIDDEEDGTSEELDKFHNRDEANTFAADQVNIYRAQHGEPRSITEEFRHNLYWCKLGHDDQKATVFSVATEIKQQSELVGFNLSTVKQIYPERAWMVYLTVTTKIIDEDTSTPLLKESITHYPDQYTHLELANNAAYKVFFDHIKPKRPKIEHMAQHENDIGPLLRDERDRCNQIGRCFDAGLDKTEEIMAWLSEDIKEVHVQVQLLTIHAPYN
jgi:hypothetical protein